MSRSMLRWLVVLAAGLGLAVWLTRGDDAGGWVDADTVTLFSVDGRDPDRRVESPTGETLHSYPVLGKADVPDADTRRRLARAYSSAVAGWPAPYNCYWPRHVVRVRRGETTTDYVICFECQTRNEYVNGVARYQNTRGIDRTAQPAFDAVLTAAGVPLAP